MVEWKSVIEKFNQKGDKSGWSYVHISHKIAEKLNPGQKKTFRIKGYIDAIAVSGISLAPMGKGDFILPLKSELRKKLGKEAGAMVSLKIEWDNQEIPHDEDLLDALEQDPVALGFFEQLPVSHQRYFSNWVKSANTAETKIYRIAQCLNGLTQHWSYGEMIRNNKKRE